MMNDKQGLLDIVDRYIWFLPEDEQELSSLLRGIEGAVRAYVAGGCPLCKSPDWDGVDLRRHPMASGCPCCGFCL